MIDEAWILARNPSHPDALRRASALLLGRAENSRGRDREALFGLLDTRVPGSIQLAAVKRLQRLGGSLQPVVSRWSSFVPSVRAAIVQAILSRKDWSTAFVAVVRDGRIPVSSLSAAERQRFTGHRDGEIARSARDAFSNDSSTDRGDVLLSFRPAVHLNGISSHGRIVFTKRCSPCHSIDGDGTAIGPDLRALTDRSGEALLSAIIDPNSAVEPRYVAYSAVLRSGDVVHGIVVGETGNSLVVQQADGSKREILRNDIAKLESSQRSFMPEGLEADLSMRDMADLIRFLQE